MLLNLLRCFLKWRSSWNFKISKKLFFAIQHFKKYILNALHISTHVPSLSAYNQIEIRMDPVSKIWSGSLLPHENFGTHLYSSRKTINTNLEKHNIKVAGKILANVLKEVVLDNFTVVADYVENADKILQNWIGNRSAITVEIPHYLLQIARCNDSKCCGDFWATWNSVFSIRFDQTLLQSDKFLKGQLF